MVSRAIVILTVLCIVLAGCKHRSKSANYKRVAQPAPVHAPVAAKPQQLFLRGPVHNTAAPAQFETKPAVTMTSLSDDAYRLDSGDALRIVVFGQENLSRTYTVDGGGFISMPLIGAVNTRGLTTFKLESKIAARLKTKYVKDPKVTVEVETYRPFFILGEVQSPGQFPYVNGMTVHTAVAIAGGYTERARESKVKVTRQVNGRTVEFKAGREYRIRPGDTIYVTERFF